MACRRHYNSNMIIMVGKWDYAHADTRNINTLLSFLKECHPSSETWITECSNIIWKHINLILNDMSRVMDVLVTFSKAVITTFRSQNVTAWFVDLHSGMITFFSNTCTSGAFGVETFVWLLIINQHDLLTINVSCCVLQLEWGLWKQDAQTHTHKHTHTHTPI